MKLDIAPLTVPPPPAIASRPLAAINAAKALSSLKSLNLESSNILVGSPTEDLHVLDPCWLFPLGNGPVICTLSALCLLTVQLLIDIKTCRRDQCQVRAPLPRMHP